MHKLMEYICEEMDELERKADKDGKLSMAEMQYLDTLAHTKKNMLKSEEMMDDSTYSMNDGSYRSYARGGQGNQGGNSYRMSYADEYRNYDTSMARGRGRNAKRDSMGRYSSANDMMVDELRNLMEEAQDDRTRQEFQRFIQKIEQM